MAFWSAFVTDTRIPRTKKATTEAEALELFLAEIADKFSIKSVGAERFYLNHGFRKTDVMEGNDHYYLRYPNEGTARDLVAASS